MPSEDQGHIPGPVYIPNCIAVRLHWRLPNQKTAFNVLHARYASVPTFTQASLNSLFSAITASFVSTGLTGNLDTQTRLVAVGLRDMRQDSVSGSGFSEVTSNNAGVDGSGAGPAGPLPHQTAFVVTLRTGFSGQANRGRVYIPGFHASADDGTGRATEAAALNCVEFITGVQAALNAQSFTLAIGKPARQEYTGATGVVHPARPASTATVQTITYRDLVWDTQRLRSHL